LGFPRFRGGPLRYIDHLGLTEFCTMVDKYRSQGPLYQSTGELNQRRSRNEPFFN
jgi:3-hydroxyacyl-CoA dehydrogenase/enoyl-CoA hydratase/3-hydroxybutyryl-CoA epimerase/enoyl-CoA isomerase